ncbi:VOC family protein [Mesorhizobium silamurunense]|nr:VOC family protein [Mesorhizobium silamurunense]
MLNAIHHVALICTDYDRSRRFYVELLGLDLIRESLSGGAAIMEG